MARHRLNATARRILSAYAAQDESSWKADYHDAMACRDLEETLRFGNGLYESIRKTVEGRRGDAQDSEDFLDLTDYFKWWLKPCSLLIAQITEFESVFTDGVEGAEEFRRNCEHARDFVENEGQIAAVETRVGFRDVELNPQAADMLNRILSDTQEGPRPAYEPKPVPLADPSILLGGH